MKELETSIQETPISRRKSEHLRIVAEMDVEHKKSTLLECVQLMHNALPELDFDHIDLSTRFFRKEISSPVMITSMTGGAEFADKMNHGLAEVADQLNIPFSVGSQRVMLRHPEVTSHFAVRSHIPDGILLGNIGGIQLTEYSVDQIAGLMEAIDADGMCVHLNAAQEMIQHDGQVTFRGVLDGIARLLDRLEGNVLVKETGAGMSPDTLERLSSIGVPYIDVSGAGGTSWSKVETYRAEEESLAKKGKLFSDWGIPTAFSLVAARKMMSPSTGLIASGGIRNGLDVAKSIAIGADVAGFARPVLLEFLKNGVEGGVNWISQINRELKTAMLLTGSSSIAGLKSCPKVFTGELREWMQPFGWLSGE
ncbi:type 2 isopentenyl-diphosphate Delta-isomerase [bacterium]|nr:type 2 isopentenyl-diphosphate Delta-isomerase [bacterium]